MRQNKPVPSVSKRRNSMKTRKELHQIREEKRKELDLRVNTKAVKEQAVLLRNHLKF